MIGCDRFSWAKWSSTSFSWTRVPRHSTVCRARSIVHPNTVSPVFYPGGGWKAESMGLGLNMGDEMYFPAGTLNNFRMTFGPFMRL